MDELELVLEAYRDTFGMKTERANEIHQLACEEVLHLWQAIEKSDPWETQLGDGWNGMVKHKFICMHCRETYDALRSAKQYPPDFHKPNCIWSFAWKRVHESV